MVVGSDVSVVWVLAASEEDCCCWDVAESVVCAEVSVAVGWVPLDDALVDEFVAVG